jgi:multiple antibiotic resistance protein|tara:strand:+ start:2087 stop:2707 length:621 start_codon:yes stop_codon:yes gene_type:complete
MHEIFFQNLLKTFIAIDPISLIPLFVVLTSNIDSKKTLNLSVTVFVISSSVLTFFLFFGNVFLSFMGISLDSFQIIGGIFLLFISYEMVFEKRIKRKTNISEEIFDDRNLKNIAVFPLSIPLIVGPSALTLSVLISENIHFNVISFYTQVFPILLVLALTSVIFFFSTYILKILNEMIIKILQKLFGIILGALSIEFIINGIKGVI